MLQNYIFAIDIDNTLTNEQFGIPCSEIETKKRIENKTLKPGVEIIRNKDFNIILVTGREEKYREVTVKWLHKNDIPFNRLIMVPDDYYPVEFYYDSYLKFKLNAYIENHVHFVLDDSNNVINLSRMYGFGAEKVNDTFDEAFRRCIGL